MYQTDQCAQPEHPHGTRGRNLPSLDGYSATQNGTTDEALAKVDQLPFGDDKFGLPVSAAVKEAGGMGCHIVYHETVTSSTTMLAAWLPTIDRLHAARDRARQAALSPWHGITRGRSAIMIDDELDSYVRSIEVRWTPQRPSAVIFQVAVPGMRAQQIVDVFHFVFNLNLVGNCKPMGWTLQQPRNLHNKLHNNKSRNQGGCCQ
jgi:hypothetical protein